MATISGNAIVAEVEKFAGGRYIYGGESPSGFDCSGLVMYVLTTLGVSGVPRTSEAQYAWATKISAADLAPGDLVFAQFPGDNASPGHVGIYTGGGKVLSAEDPADGIGYSTLDSWGSAIVGYGRVPDGTAGADTASTDSALSGLLAFPSTITGFFQDSKTFIDALLWIVNPASWLRIGAFVVGIMLLMFALWSFMRMGNGQPILPQSVPMPVPV